jgi:hypothetical protein
VLIAALVREFCSAVEQWSTADQVSPLPSLSLSPAALFLPLPRFFFCVCVFPFLYNNVLPLLLEDIVCSLSCCSCWTSAKPHSTPSSSPVSPCFLLSTSSSSHKSPLCPLFTSFRSEASAKKETEEVSRGRLRAWLVLCRLLQEDDATLRARTSDYVSAVWRPSFVSELLYLKCFLLVLFSFSLSFFPLFLSQSLHQCTLSVAIVTADVLQILPQQSGLPLDPSAALVAAYSRFGQYFANSGFLWKYLLDTLLPSAQSTQPHTQHPDHLYLTLAVCVQAAPYSLPPGLLRRTSSRERQTTSGKKSVSVCRFPFPSTSAPSPALSCF